MIIIIARYTQFNTTLCVNASEMHAFKHSLQTVQHANYNYYLVECTVCAIYTALYMYIALECFDLPTRWATEGVTSLMTFLANEYH